jgi:RNA polymerase sigma factor (TIGR02999 family)
MAETAALPVMKMLPDHGLSPEVMGLVYVELRRIARGIVRGEHDEESLGSCGLVCEAVGRLLTREGYRPGDSPERILGLTVRAMGRVLIDRARARTALKRGGGRRRESLDDVIDTCVPPGIRFEDLYESIERLGSKRPDYRQLIERHHFGGLTLRELADMEGTSVRTIEKRLDSARGWLRRDLLAR